MFFRWLKRRRRQNLLAQPFPEAWHAVLRANVSLYANLTEPEQARVRDYLRVFIAEKHWEGCRGFEITEGVQVTVAAQVAILMLGFGEEFFPRLQTILVYPEVYVGRDDRSAGGAVLTGESEREGETSFRGPVILSWPDVLTDARGETGRNLVLHEFAHQLDMAGDGDCDGVPPLGSAKLFERWRDVTEREFEQLRHDLAHGRRTLLGDYAATSKVEFLAVATELFFERPQSLHHRHGELYDLLAEFFQQDPLSRQA